MPVSSKKTPATDNSKAKPKAKPKAKATTKTKLPPLPTVHVPEMPKAIAAPAKAKKSKADPSTAKTKAKVPNTKSKSKAKYGGYGCNSGDPGPALAFVGSKLGYAMGEPTASESASVPMSQSLSVAYGVGSFPLPAQNNQIIRGLENGTFQAGTPLAPVPTPGQG